MIFSNNSTRIDDNVIHQTRSLFDSNPSFRYQFASRDQLDKIARIANDTHDGQITSTMARSNAFQVGANLGLQLGFAAVRKNVDTHNSNNSAANDSSAIADGSGGDGGWFYDYDWIIRVNPDVLIRDSTFLRHVMMYNNDDSSSSNRSNRNDNKDRVDAILVDCNSTTRNGGPRRIHTDFFAIRPSTIIEMWKYRRRSNNNTPFMVMSSESWNKHVVNHETTFYDVIRPLIKQKRHIRYLPNTDNSNGSCRVRGSSSPVIHTHTKLVDVEKCHAAYARHDHDDDADVDGDDDDTNNTCSVLGDGWKIT
jgi:hypothetical protein